MQDKENLMIPRVISFVGKSGSGKTTLLEKLIPEFKRRGYRLGIIKHAHSGFDMDKKGKDSWRHKQAGADATLVVSPNTIAMVKDEALTSALDTRKYLGDMDLIIAEGFKQEHLPRIEVFRKSAGHGRPLFQEGFDISALVTDLALVPGVPVFGLENILEIADFIEKNFILKGRVVEKVQSPENNSDRP